MNRFLILLAVVGLITVDTATSGVREGGRGRSGSCASFLPAESHGSGTDSERGFPSSPGRRVGREKLEAVVNSDQRTFDEMGSRSHKTWDTVLWESNGGGAGGNDPI